MVTKKKSDDAVVVDVDTKERKFRVKMKSWVWILTLIIGAAGTLLYFLRAIIFK
jgi:hypothetical protein